MHWEEYYEKIDNWSNATAVQRLSKLETFGPSEEVAYAIHVLAWENEKAAARLLKMATEAGVKFSGEELVDMVLICDENVIEQAVQCSKDRFTEEDLDILYGTIDDELLIEIASARNLKLPTDLDYDHDDPNLSGEVSSKMNTEELKENYQIILNCLLQAEHALKNALLHSIADVGSNRRAFAIAKYALILEANGYIEDAIIILEDVKEANEHWIDLSNITLNVSKKVGFTDILLDGVFLDWAIQKKIKKSLKMIANKILEARKVLDTLTS